MLEIPVVYSTVNFQSFHFSFIPSFFTTSECEYNKSGVREVQVTLVVSVLGVSGRGGD